jgi:DNA-binding MarR family transcriptional regulator
VGQTSRLPLPHVLDNLRQAQGDTVDKFYTYIYWQAWHLLDEASRQLLLMMPLAPPQGSGLAHLAAVSGLDGGALSQAIEQLAALSLLEVSGSLSERRYRIHRLTETFLLTEVAKW